MNKFTYFKSLTSIRRKLIKVETNTKLDITVNRPAIPRWINKDKSVNVSIYFNYSTSSDLLNQLNSSKP